MESNNTQKSGSNSNQVQIINPNFNIGITEERVRGIIKEEIASYNEIAQDIAMTRSKIIEEKIISKLVKEKLLEELAKPENLVAIQDTVRQAICTNDEKSYELLSKLLSNRIKYSNGRLIASSLKNATEVAIEITDEALLGLTVFFLLDRISPTYGIIAHGLQALNDTFGIVDLSGLPSGKWWIDQLDVLKLVRINSFGVMEKILDIYSRSLTGYICVGIKKNSEQHKEAIKILEKANLSNDNLITHELNDEYVRLQLAKVEDFDGIRFYNINRDLVSISLEQKQAFKKIIELYEINEDVLSKNKERFVKMWNQFPNLQKVRDWWDKIEIPFNITMVGLVLACTNINENSKNKYFPKIELKDLVKWN